MIVQKFGGPAVSSITRIKRVCRRIADTARSGKQVVAVVSAMGRTTDELMGLAYRISPDPPRRELDMLIANGETIAAPLVAMGLQGLGVPAVSLSAVQAGVRTDDQHSMARVLEVRPVRVQRALRAGQVAVVAGFQGVTRDLELTTLGRGGADTTAVALAAALRAELCEMYSTADGILSADARVVPEARLLQYVSYEECLELAAMGLRVMQPRAVEMAGAYGVPIHVRSAFNTRPGTMIVAQVPEAHKRNVCAIAHEDHIGRVRVLGVPNRPGIAAELFEPLGRHGISVDVIAQVGGNDLGFVLGDGDLGRALAAVGPTARALGARVAHADGLAKVSLVGAGMRGAPGTAALVFRTLADTGVDLEMVATSEIRITCVVPTKAHERAVRALHAAFVDRANAG